MLKKIGTEARKGLEGILGQQDLLGTIRESLRRIGGKIPRRCATRLALPLEGLAGELEDKDRESL